MRTLIKLLRLTVFCMVIVIVAYTCYGLANRYLPDKYNPFAPLNINDPPNFLTYTKVMLLKNSDAACFNVLQASDLDYVRMLDRETGESCGFYGAAMLKQSGISYGGDITLTCPALVGLAVWEQHDLQPLAEQILGQKIVRVRHYGTYACRNVNNSSGGRRSQHAYANAIDISGFALEDGKEISVLDHWAEDGVRGQFLKAVHNSACKRFSTVLGPNYNDLHRDHFHFDQGRSSICR